MGGIVTQPKMRQSDTAANISAMSIWRRILGQAIRTNATDIHIEPQIEKLLIRFRRQGALSTGLTLATNTAKPLAKQIKQLANLDLRQTKAPQDGTFTQVYNHHTYHLSVDTMPLLSGERMVAHIHDPAAQPPELAALGLWGKGLTCFQNALAEPRGIILISGAGHSGIPTTLASCAAALSSSFHRIASVEENATYQVANVNYMAVKPSNGMTWSRVLRMQLKHMPDVVILGNMPDRETAEIAVDAASKQLVLGGIRSSGATAAVTQLLRLSGNPLGLATSLRLICYQNLVPRLCPECREVYTPDLAMQNHLSQMFRLGQGNNAARLQQLESEATGQLQCNQALATAKSSINEAKITQLWRAKPGGCSKCRKSGFNGATALFGVTPISEVLRSHLAQSSTVSHLSEIVIKDQTISLQVDALVKALCGLVTIETVIKSLNQA